MNISRYINSSTNKNKKIKRIIFILSIVICTMIFVSLGTSKIYAASFPVANIDYNANNERAQMLEIELLVLLVIIVVIALELIYAIFRKKINLEEEKDYNKCLKIISHKRRFVIVLATFALAMIPLWQVVYVIYNNITSHIIIG